MSTTSARAACAAVTQTAPRGVPAVRRGTFIKQFRSPGRASGIVCFNFWELVVAAGCPFRCSYCFLQATPSYVFGHYPLSGAVFSNWKDMLREVEQWLTAPSPRMLVVGELQDGLAFDGVYRSLAGTALTEMLIPLFARQKRHRLLFLTKSTAIRHALRLPPTQQVVFSWSLNAEEAARRWEIGAPPPARRLDAARRMALEGWPIRFRLDPIIPFEGWREGYGQIADKINTLGPEMVTLGCLRASSTLQSHARRNGRDSSLFDMLSGKDPGGFKKRLPRDEQIEMLRFVHQRLDHQRFTVALCKEHRTVWNAVGMLFTGCHCLPGPGGDE